MSDKPQLTMIDDNSEGFYVEWLGDDGKLFSAEFPVRNGAAHPDQHVYAVECVRNLYAGMESPATAAAVDEIQPVDPPPDGLAQLRAENAELKDKVREEMG